MKARLFFLLAAVAAILPLQAFDTPHDLPTIEALISLHKLIKGNEDQALARVTASFGEQSIVTKGATEFNAARSTLDSKLSGGYSAILLASALAGTGTDLYKLIDEYARFTSSTARTLFHKPMCAWYYTEAGYACTREMKNIRKMAVTLSAGSINLMKASMDEKLVLVNQLREYIGNMKAIIEEAYAWCSVVMVGGFHYDYIWDILNSDVTDGIAKGVINKWYNL